MATMMNVDHGLTLQQWVGDPNRKDWRQVPVFIANLLMATGSWEELDNFIYKNGNDPTLGERYFSKITLLLGAEGDMNASLQWFMKECSVAAGFPNIGNGYQNVHQYEQAQPLSNATRSEKFGFGAQKGNEQWHAKLRKAVHSLKKKAEEAAATGGGTPVPPPMMASHFMPPQGNLPQGNPPQGMPPQGMPPQGMTGTPQYASTPTGMYAHHRPPPPVDTPTTFPNHHGHGIFSPFSPHTTQQPVYHSHHAFNGGLNSTYGGVPPGTPSNNYSHTPSGPSSMHAPPPAKGSSFSGEEENVNFQVGAPSSSGLGDVDALSRAVRGLDFGAASSLRSVNDDVSSIGGTEDTLVQTTKMTEKDLMKHATFRAMKLHQDWLSIQESRDRREKSRACTSTTPFVYNQYRNEVLVAVKQDELGREGVSNAYLQFKELCENEELKYDEEKQWAEGKIEEIESTLESEAKDLEEQKNRLRDESKEKKDVLDAECKAEIATLQNQIAKLKNRLALLPAERDEKKGRVDTECDANISKLQIRHEQQNRLLNRKLQSYRDAKERLQAQKEEHLTYPMAYVRALELTNTIYEMYEGPIMNNVRDQTLWDDIQRQEEKLDSLLVGIANKERGNLVNHVWNYPGLD